MSIKSGSENRIPIALAIAGSDSGGGAGIQADIKTFSAMGVYGASVVTAVTAQNTRAVTAVHDVPPEIVHAQIDAVLNDLSVDAIKIGMLATTAIIKTVARSIETFHGPVVLDPVMVAKSGDALLPPDAVSALIEHLLPLATVVTPNLPEAEALAAGKPGTDTESCARSMRQLGEAIIRLGADCVLVKGGHDGDEVCTDWLVQHNRAPLSYAARRVETTNTHGTGCTYSSAITAQLACGSHLHQAVEIAHRYVHQAICAADALNVGRGHGPVHHFYQTWRA